MDKVEKFLKNLPKKQQQKIRDILHFLQAKEFDGLHIIKVADTPYYRLRTEKIRIIFRYDESGGLRLKRIQFRSEKTYKNL